MNLHFMSIPIVGIYFLESFSLKNKLYCMNLIISHIPAILEFM